jgi:hypothetical protein
MSQEFPKDENLQAKIDELSVKISQLEVEINNKNNPWGAFFRIREEGRLLALKYSYNPDSSFPLEEKVTMKKSIKEYIGFWIVGLFVVFTLLTILSVVLK